MVIKKIYLKNYKILKDFSLELDKQISVVIGINGSGKSSILEALALIFSSAYEQIVIGRKNKASDLIHGCFVDYFLRYEQEVDRSSTHSSFQIDYIPVHLVVNDNGRIRVSVNASGKENNEFRKQMTAKYEAHRLLPSRLIIYYSGISKHFSDIYQTSEDFLLRQLTQNPERTTTGYIEDIQMPMYLFSPEHFDLLFAGLWSFAYNQRLQDLLYNKLKLQEGSQGLIVIKVNQIEFDKDIHSRRLKELNDEIMGDPEGFLDDPEKLESMTNELEREREDSFFGASGRLGTFLRQMREFSFDPGKCFDASIKEYTFTFSLDKWQQLGEEELQNPKKIFELLLMLKQNHLLKSLEVNIVKNDQLITGSRLSEGEKQILIIAALNEILGDNNTLFLFDEPDNYLHPSLQDDLIRNIEDSNRDISEIYQNHYFVTTHNSSLLSSLNSETGELLIMNDGKLYPHEFSWYGRDANDTLHDIMGSNFRPSWARIAIQEVDELLDMNLIKMGEEAFKILRDKLSGDDIDVVRLQTKLDFLKD